MITYEILHKQNHKITELSNVLMYLISDRSMCDTETTCDLFFDFVDRVKAHFEIVDRDIYSQLIRQQDENITLIANNFASGSIEIKKLISRYLKKWCEGRRHSLKIRDHDEFIQETYQMFNFVLNRIQDETEHLYPLLKKVTGDPQYAA